MSSLNQNVIRHKIGLLNLAVELGNVSKACKVMGLSRDAFYRYQNAVAEGGVDALFDSNRRKPNPKNRVDEATEIAVLAYAIEQPAHGQVRVSNELRRRGIFVSPSGVRSIGLRHELSSFKLRLVALEKQVAEKGIVLSDDQVAALERKQDDDLAHGEIETAHPGYLGSQDTFYVGTIKAVGRIYQQTFAPAAETAANEASRTVSGSESGDIERHPVRAQDRHSMEPSANPARLRLGGNLLAPTSRLAQSRRGGSPPRTIARQTAGGRPDRFFTCRRRFIIGTGCWGGPKTGRTPLIVRDPAPSTTSSPTPTAHLSPRS